jgi:hypothetical protein
MTKKKIDVLVEKKKKEMDIVYFKKYSSLFHDAYSFLAGKKALLYGGTALNELLPTNLKIYDPYTLPDIDVLSPYAEKLAQEMVRFYKKKKHQAVSFTEALHPGTYKVYADGFQIADITKCGNKTYEELRRNCVRSKQWKIKIVPPQYIRMTLHKILSQPNDAHRWENVYDRLKKFYKTYPVKCSLKTKDDAKKLIHKEIEEKKIYDILPPDVVFVGKKEVGMLLGKDVPVFQAPIQALTDRDLMEISKMLKDEIPELHISGIFPNDNFVPAHIVVSLHNNPIATIYKLSSCVAFNEFKNKRIANINTTIDILLSLSMSHHQHFKRWKPLLECLADELAIVQQTSKSKKKILDQFVMACQGPSEGLVTMRRKRATRLYRKKKTNNLY